jgi:hypothetical protein
MIPTCEVVFEKSERYKEKFSADINKLFGAIRENLWEQRIYVDTVGLLARVAQEMPKFTITPKEPINRMQTITNESFVQLCRYAHKAYAMDENYHEAVNFLKNFIELCEQIPSFDRLILDYLKGVTEKYSLMLNLYEDHIDREVDEKASTIFQGNNYRTWLAAKNGVQVFEKLKSIGRKSNDISMKKSLWFSLIKQNKEIMEFSLYSGKK